MKRQENFINCFRLPHYPPVISTRRTHPSLSGRNPPRVPLPDQEGSSHPTPPLVTGIPMEGGSYYGRDPPRGTPPIFAGSLPTVRVELRRKSLHGSARKHEGTPCPHPSHSGRDPPGVPLQDHEGSSRPTPPLGAGVPSRCAGR